MSRRKGDHYHDHDSQLYFGRIAYGEKARRDSQIEIENPLAFVGLFIFMVLLCKWHIHTTLVFRCELQVRFGTVMSAVRELVRRITSFCFCACECRRGVGDDVYLPYSC